MSHTTRLKGVNIKDASAIRKAIKDLQKAKVNCEMLTDAKPRMYSAGQSEKCEIVLKLNDGKYDVGFQKQKDGSYQPMFDEYMSHVGGQIGAACPLPTTSKGRAQHQIGKFMQYYAKHAAINAARKKGYTVESTSVDGEGNVQVVLAA